MIKKGYFEASVLESFNDELKRNVLEGLFVIQLIQRKWPGLLEGNR